MDFEIYSLSSIKPINEIGMHSNGIYQPFRLEKTEEVTEKIIPAPEGIGFLCELLGIGVDNKNLLKKGNNKLIRT